jgi:ribosomal protein S18 acetylase RimI-like enzyme
MAKDIARRLRDQKVKKPFPKSGYELRPIVVSTSERGSGLAAKLVNVLVDDARKRGFGEIYLITEQDNIAANAFYPKLDFHMAGEVKSLGQLYYIYERSLESSL